MAARCRLYFVLVLLSLGILVSSQVTFSRDWSGGKRSGPVVFDCGQFARACRHFLNDLKNAMSTDGLRKRMEPEELPRRYEHEADE